MNAQFLLNYQGNKYRESFKLDYMDFSKYKTIVEGFCGSFGFSRYLYNIKKLTNINYVLIDNDKELIDLYLHIQQLLKDDNFVEFNEEYNNQMEKIYELYGMEVMRRPLNKYKDRTRINRKPSLLYLETIQDKHIRKWLKINISSAIISRIYYKRKLEFLNLIKNATFICEDFASVDFSIYDKESTLVYLDPPYILECNKFYADQRNITRYYDKLLNIFETHTCLFIHSFNYLIEKIWGKYRHSCYLKKYKNTGKETMHIVYHNDKIERQ